MGDSLYYVVFRYRGITHARGGSVQRRVQRVFMPRICKLALYGSRLSVGASAWLKLKPPTFSASEVHAFFVEGLFFVNVHVF